jgi:TonB-dependent starch-binding outer membrane protein SusC
MVRKILFSLAFFLATTFSLLAQTGNVNGKIVDSNNEALIGANVVVKGTTIGTITNIDGNYVLQNIPVGQQTLVASFIGYVSQEIPVTVTAGSSTEVNFKLAENVTALEELVVIGYGTVKKSDATGSVVAINAKDFNKGAISTPDQLITGKVAGVSIISGGGAPGAGQTIRIRGGASLNASNDPLIVVDGLPLDNSSGISGLSNPLTSINPNDIESISVLKDASATAIYGSRASNGVIIITTKKGVKDKPIRVEYQGTFSINKIKKYIDVLTADEFRSAVNDYANIVSPSDPSIVTNLLDSSNTDWQKEIYRTSYSTDHNVSVSGDVKKIPYRFSVGYTNENGILKTSEVNRTSLSLNLNPSFFDDYLKVNINAKGSFMGVRFANESAIGAAVQMDPTKPVMGNDSTFYYWGINGGSPMGQATKNPLSYLELTDDQSDVNRFIGNVQLDYKFHFFPDLKANLNLGYDRSKSDGYKRESEKATWQFNPSRGNGAYKEYTQEKTNKLLDFYLQYTKDIVGIDSYFDLMGGYSYQDFWKEDFEFQNTIEPGTTTNAIGVIVAPNYNPTEYINISFFGRMNYHFKERYLLTVTMRNDYSSRFSKNKRSGLFPSVALAWNIAKEPWMENITVLSQFKIRAGWGVTGQQNITDNDYPYQANYSLSTITASYPLGENFYRALRASAYDENIKWEETTTLNLGVDYGFLQDRFYGSFEIYKKKSIDLINRIPIPAGSNFSNYVYTNVGDMENKGFEMNIIGRLVSTKDIQWEVGFNCTYNKNKITKLTAHDDPSYIGVATGGISGGVGSNIQIHTVGYPVNSFFVYEQVYDKDGNPVEGLYIDRNKDGQITDNDKYHYKDPNADFYFGINSSLNYKNWTFAFTGRAQFNNYVYNNIYSNNGELSRLYRPEGPYLSNVTSNAKEDGFLTPQYMSDYYIENASFFRMDNITLSYNFKSVLNQKIDLRVSGIINNAFVITKYQGLDPEISGGIDNNMYPRPRVFMLGLNLVF